MESTHNVTPGLIDLVKTVLFVPVLLVMWEMRCKPAAGASANMIAIVERRKFVILATDVPTLVLTSVESVLSVR